MRQTSKKISSNLFYNERPAVQNILALVSLAALVIIFIVYGSSLPAYALFVALALIFILPAYNYLGLMLIIFLTMLFERFFTLQPLLINDAVYKLYPLDIVMAITLIAWAINWRWGKIKPKLFLEWPEKLLLFFLIAVCLYLVRSLSDVNASLAVAFSSFKNYTWYPLLYFLTIFTIQDAKKFKNFLHLLLITGIMLVGYIIIGISSGQGLWTEFTPLSTAGVRLLAGTHAFYLLLLSLIAFSLYAFDRFKNNAIAALLIWIWILGIVISLMRHLWLGLALGVLILLAIIPLKNKKIFLRQGAKNILIALTVIVIIILIASLTMIQNTGLNFYGVLNTFSQRLVSIYQNSADTSASWRLDLWYSAKQLWLTNPIFGLGFGKSILLNWQNWHSFEEIRNLHNSPLAILVQMGVIGLGLFLAAVAGVLIAGLKSITAANELRPYYLGIFIGIIVYLFCSLFQPYLETNLMGIFFWIWLGLLRTSKLLITDKDSDSGI